jgi:hypothetical protein
LLPDYLTLSGTPAGAMPCSSWRSQLLFQYPGLAHSSFGRSKLLCPRCHSLSCTRSRRRGVADFVLSVFRLRPWRCKACESRFYAWIVPVSLLFYAHCPRCGMLHLDRISARHITQGPLHRVKRMLGFAAYRCDPCRQRFFSIRPYREILPLGASGKSKRRSHHLAAAEPPKLEV